MPQHEIEIKIDLQEEVNYKKLLGYFTRKSGEIKQENYFFDTDDWKLTKSGWAIRIRLVADKAELTAKGPSELISDNMVVRPEMTENLSSAKAAEFIKHGFLFSDIDDSEISKVLKLYTSFNAVNCRIRFINYRIDAPFANSDSLLNFEIDRTIFVDGSTDYELEVELPERGHYDGAIKRILELFSTLGIPLIFQKKSKFARAIDRSSKNNFV